MRKTNKTRQDITPKPETREKFFIDAKPPQLLHKQSRSYLKTTASLVGKDTSGQRSLFEIPYFDNDINPLKDVLSKMTAITGNHLLAKWQTEKDENGVYTIKSLNEVAKQLGVEPRELKIYLIYLGGYQRPITRLEITKEKGKKEKRILAIYHDKLFFIKFNIRLRDNEKDEDFNNDARVGTNYLNFIKDRDIDSVEVMPSFTLQEDLNGSGLGNILVDDNFVAFSLGLSDLAYKLFCFSGSNKPTFKINFNKLTDKKYLNLTNQLKKQGKPRILKTIQTALKELQDKGHLTKWSYDETTEQFSWTYSGAFFKHKELLKEKAETLKIDTAKIEPRQEK